VLLQDVLVKLIGKVSVLMTLERCKLVSYIVCTVRNTAINRLHHRTIVNHHIDGQELTEDIFPADYEERSVENTVLFSLQMEEFGRILALLPDSDERLLRGKYMLSLSDSELAEMLHCKPSSIRMMLTRARRKAYALLEKEGFRYGGTR
jgi:RNA polymerase sigma-70 factor (ECF subfamily)